MFPMSELTAGYNEGELRERLIIILANNNRLSHGVKEDVCGKSRKTQKRL